MRIWKRILFVLLTGALFIGEVGAAEPSPFSTDLCTGFPNGTRSEPSLWASCCLRHDLAYWAGGTSRNRLAVDHALQSCVKATGAKMQSEIMWLGVRIGALSPLKFAGKQWGNTWGKNVRSTSLSIEEIESLELSLRLHSDLDLALIETFIEGLRAR